ncbi:MAG: phage late control D family protein [Myxococcota bacterium]
MPSEHVLTVEVKIDGSSRVSGDSGDVDLKDGSYVSRIQVDQRLDSPDFFSVSFQMMSHADFILLDCFKPGAEVEIILGYDAPATVFKGEISYVEPSFSTDEHLITISGYDKVHRLTRGTSSRTWGDGHETSVKVGDVASQVIGDSKARKGDTSDSLSGSTDSGQSQLEYVPQVEVNDYQFMRSLGTITGIDLDSESSDNAAKLAFKKVDLSGSPKVVVCRERKDPTDARLGLTADFVLSTVQQVAKVEVRGWNPKEKKPILGKAEAPSSTLDGTPGHKQAGKAHYGSAGSGRVLTVVDVPVASDAEAEEIATSIFDQLSMDFMTGDLVVEGVPDVTAGDVVELKQYGNRYSGKYLVDSAQHVVMAGTAEPYRTRLHLVRNAAPEA